MLQCGLVDYHQTANAAAQQTSKPTHPVMPPSARLFQTQVQGPPPPRIHPASSAPVDSELGNVSRIPSVVGILSHLALDFEEELKEKMATLFEVQQLIN